jgi:hypothetical protein
MAAQIAEQVQRRSAAALKFFPTEDDHRTITVDIAVSAFVLTSRRQHCREREIQMTIADMMKDRAALTRQLKALPNDLASEAEFKETFDRRWALENLILERQVITLADLKAQLRVSADRADYLGNGWRRPDSASRLNRKEW